MASALTLTSALDVVAGDGLEGVLLLHRFVLHPHFFFAYTELLRQALQLGLQPPPLDSFSDLFGFTQHIVDCDAILFGDALRLNQVGAAGAGLRLQQPQDVPSRRP